MLRSDRFDEIKDTQKLSDEDMAKIGVLKIHPAFRMIALAEPPVIGRKWLNCCRM
jgi:hypothetical protein